MNEILSQAIIYADKMGWKIHPCTIDKKPYLKDWPHNASSNVEQIKKWWKQWPEASIGCKCGPDSGLWVVDVDLPDGPEALNNLESENSLIGKVLRQKTGSGGEQLFFKWNGENIRNSSRKLGRCIDIRGDGGYIVLPPSDHPSGGRYEWIEKTALQPAPKWLIEKLIKPEPPVLLESMDKNEAYGLAALSKEIIKLSSCSEGARNTTLNEVAFSLGQLIAGGVLDESHVFNSLFGIATGLGLPGGEAKATIMSGFKSGYSKPRQAPVNNKDIWDYSCLDDNKSKQSKQSKQSDREEAEVSGGKQEVSRGKQDLTQSSPQNLAAHIKEWVTNSTGSFTTEQLDREFCLTTRAEKNNRSKVLYILLDKELIKRDKRIKGKYHILDSQTDWIDIKNIKTEKFNLKLPFGLHNDVLIPPKAIIILAGSSNAGKTALNLNILHDNLHSPYGLNYLMSEMGGAEYVDRLKNFGGDIEKWSKVKAASKSYDFESTIQHHNKHGLTVIDYLEEVEGEYFKIPSSIRECYDALGDGVAIISIQKKGNAEFARGGEGTIEKARLYLTVDLIHVSEIDGLKRIYCAMKCIKSKHNLNRNLTGRELHFSIDRGAILTEVMGWTPSYKVDREQCRRTYAMMDERPDITPDDESLWFRVLDDTKKRITKKQAGDWQNSFQNIDVNSELLRLQESSEKKPFMEPKNYFFTISGILRKKNISKIGGGFNA